MADGNVSTFVIGASLAAIASVSSLLLRDNRTAAMLGLAAGVLCTATAVLDRFVVSRGGKSFLGPELRSGLYGAGLACTAFSFLAVKATVAGSDPANQSASTGPDGPQFNYWKLGK